MEGNWEVSGTESHRMSRLLLLETAIQTFGAMAMEFADSGMEVLLTGDSGSFANKAWPEYNDCE